MALQRNRLVTEDALDEVVHCRLVKFTPIFATASFALNGCQGCRPSDFLFEEVADVYRIFLPTKQTAWDTGTSYIVAFVRGGVTIVVILLAERTGVEVAIERLFLAGPDCD